MNGLFGTNNLLGAALNATGARHEVITNNIANAEVPNFKKSEVQFESYFKRVVDSATVNGKIDFDAIDFKKLNPTIKRIDKDFKYRLDGNNVDIETEMVDLYQNSMRYDTLVNGVMKNYQLIKSVLSLK